MPLDVKICGLSTRATCDAALAAGADMVGLVFFSASPRHVDLGTAADLARAAQGRASVVALTVDADDAQLAAIVETVRPDLLQLHGRESPARVAEIKRRFALPVMKALPIATRDDLAALPDYAAVADRILFDARAPKGATRPGGLGVAFDWTLLRDLELTLPFMVSGGLTLDNVADALRITRAGGVDISSGVESAPGVKDPELIRAFIRAARATERLSV
uniref:N-(5'-phosphoribosyl)anthranilate isomerase n=1 Tax=Rhodopseudomonas palustris (strain BisA53) TaxID=316055 RepID=TRPF_RHOP5|nr:RecName: Full=N-(5'-phosphoribosyl)anthranilate isomerase; Short=PRAI [Rhodopseudomonas palustris BisA53]